jgi:hypothetical protein
MRLRHIALGCTLTAALGSLALSTAPARADSITIQANTVHAKAKTPALPKPKLTIRASASSYGYGAKVKLTVTLGATVKDRKVSFYVSQYGVPGRRLIASANVGSGGWKPAYKVTKKTTFYAFFGGDSHNAATTVGTTVQVRASVASALGGSSKTAKVGGIVYRVFTTKQTLSFNSTVAPKKGGECLQPESQQLDGKTWDADTKYGCDTLNSGSHDSAAFTLNQAVGDKYRIRGDYGRSAKDLANLSADGPWLYFEVVK